ncbi:MAG: ABC transporter permease [Acidovorax sp.]|jgi:ABC-2 type transport system permease protein|uniref:ABC transporter permease n=1 Tax=Acidovorax sp. TaxID=1872122 RepID=UPI00260366CD|nr:ABC transporter permease [Acidovorax sp.]MDH4416283.1 ABC transporter permease [Acidovorax sp.]
MNTPALHTTAAPRSLLYAWLQTLAIVVRDKGVLLLLIGAPVLYGFFYPWFYADEVLTRVPVAVVDMDRTSLSRQITRFADADPRIEVRLVTGSEHEAQQALWRGEIEGYAVIPPHLKRSVVRGENAVVSIEANGAYALLNKAVQFGFAEAVGTVSAAVEIRKLQSSGHSAQQAQASRAPVQLQTVALFNPIEGYGSFVVPAVALLILQQTLLMGAALLTGTWVEAGQHRACTTAWLGRMLALCTLGWASGIFYFGWIFVLHDYPRGGNPLGALALLACYVPAVAAMGALLGLWFGNRERALQVLLFTTLPIAFVAGFSWPVEALPEPLQWLRWLLPSTSGVQASLRLNQLGAPLQAALPYLCGLVVLGAVCTAAVLYTARPLTSPRSSRV